MVSKCIVTSGVGVFCLFLAGCFGMTSRDSEALKHALKKVPLPPGSHEMQIGGDDMPESFYMVAPYTGATEEELLQFYTSWFMENGWTSSIQGDDGLAKVLSYGREGAQMTVTVLDAGPALQLVVTYAEPGSEAVAVPGSLHFLDTVSGIDMAPSAPTP